MAPASSARSTAISLAIHAAVIAALLSVVPRAAPPAQPPQLADAFTIALTDPPPPPRSAHAGGDNTPAAPGRVQPLGLHGHDAPHTIRRAARRADPYAELAVTYDTPASPEGNGPGAPTGSVDGTGVDGHGTGLGLGIGGDGRGGFDLPEPPHPSLARDPRPKYDYSERTVRGSRQYRGQILLVDLRVDKHGRVHGARIVQGIEPHFDLRVVALGTEFEFDPALDASGAPVEGTYRWQFRVHLL
ncbi:MAG TPA: hypothetical protein VFP84_23780 [Kofleriaceae bacterium]|nr:hypothetical protein [Kofleriaceae bacterium]